jgi:aminoglycoside 3-N-acetyltransferase I
LQPLVYRQLAPTDIELLKDLMLVFGAAFGDIETYSRAVPSDAYLSRLSAKPHVIALVAMADDTVVGGLTAYELDKFEQDRREIYVYDLAVAEVHRRRGVATGLLKALKTIAAEREAYVIFLQADPSDGPAIALYESMGTKEAVLHFDIEVKLAKP